MSVARPVRVLALAPYPPSAPSTRFRVAQLQAALAALGVEVTLHSFLTEEAYRTVRRAGPLKAANAVVGGFEALRSVLERLRAYDAVLVQRGIGMLLDRQLLDAIVRRDVPLIYDFDDSVFLRQENGRRWVEVLRDPAGTTRAFCRAARVVLAGNEHLADYARSVVDRRHRHRVQVVPSVVDTDRFRPAGDTPAREPPTLGWVGSDTTVAYLEALAPALGSLAERVPHRLVVVAGQRRPHLPGADHEFVEWDEAHEVAHFQALDVGLYPLEDSPWSRGKCGFKAIQYLACAVPCVASPVGVLKDIVRPGETGLHARTTEEWLRACEVLLRDPEQRMRLGSSGRRMVQEHYSVDVGAPLIADAVREATDR